MNRTRWTILAAACAGALLGLCVPHAHAQSLRAVRGDTLNMTAQLAGVMAPLDSSAMATFCAPGYWYSLK